MTHGTHRTHSCVISYDVRIKSIDETSTTTSCVTYKTNLKVMYRHQLLVFIRSLFDPVRPHTLLPPPPPAEDERVWSSGDSGLTLLSLCVAVLEHTLASSHQLDRNRHNHSILHWAKEEYRELLLKFLTLYLKDSLCKSRQFDST